MSNAETVPIVAHKEPGILHLTLVLAATTTIAGLILGFVAYFTMPIAIQNDLKRKEAARKELLPAAVSFEAIPGRDECFEGRNADGRPVGYVLKTVAHGYGGAIVMIVGVDENKRIVDYRIMQHNETPGLGEIAKKDRFRKQFAGRDRNVLEVTKRGEEGKVQAITGATITTVAVVKAIRSALESLDNPAPETGAKPEREGRHE